MFASAATASGSTPLTAHSSARRLNNSRLICEISPSSASLRCVTSTCAAVASSNAAAHRSCGCARPDTPPDTSTGHAARRAGSDTPRSSSADPPPTARRATSARARTIQPPAAAARQQLAHTQVADLQKHRPVCDSLTGSPILPPAAQRGDHRRHLDQHLERQRTLRRHRATIGRRLIQLQRSDHRRRRTHTSRPVASRRTYRHLKPLSRTADETDA